MEFLGLKIIGLLIYTGIIWYIGRNWPVLNSVSDIENAYKQAVATVEKAKAKVVAEATAAEAKAAALKALLP